MTHPNESDDRKSAEIRAPTVDEAVARGLVRLGGLSRSEVEIEIIEEPRSGILGFGASDALVRITALAPGAAAAGVSTPEPGKPREAPSRARAAPTESRPRSARAEPAARSAPVEAPPSATPAEPRSRLRSRSGPRSRATTPDSSETAVGGEEGAGAPYGGREDDWGPLPEIAAPEAPSRERERTRRRAGGTPAEHEGAGTAVDPDVAAAAALEVVGGLLERLGYAEARVSRSNAWLPDDLSDDRSLVIAVDGSGCEALLAHDLEGLRALQFVARLMLARRADGWVNLLIDVNGDRARRVQELVDLAKQSATLVEREGRPVSLPPMSAYERRVVHIVLKDHPVVATQSIGTGDYRKVTVRRLDQMLPEL